MKRSQIIVMLIGLVFLVVAGALTAKTIRAGAKETAEKVCLKDATKEQKDLITRFDKEYYSNDPDWIKSISAAVVDINNDNKPDIVYTDSGRMGSGGVSWSLLLNLGNDRYVVMDIFELVSGCIAFLPEMKNGFRVAKIDGITTCIYDAKKRLYTPITKKLNKKR